MNRKRADRFAVSPFHISFYKLHSLFFKTEMVNVNGFHFGHAFLN